MPTTWTLEDLYRGIARGWKALVIVVITCLLAAYAAFHVFPEKYAATAIHTVEPISVLSAGSSFSTVNMDTEQIVATSTEVLEQAAATLADGTTAAQLSGALETEVPRGSQVLRFIVTTSDPRVSAAWANAIASAYGTQRSEAARAVVAQTSEELERTIDELRERLSQQKPGSPEAASTELQLEALVAEQARLLATPFYAGSLITPAVEPRDSERPSVLVFAAGGLFLGLLLGSLLALLTSGRAHLHSRQGTTATSTAQEGRPSLPGARNLPPAPAPTDRPVSAATVRHRASSTALPRTSGTPVKRSPSAEQPAAATGRGLPARLRLRSSR